MGRRESGDESDDKATNGQDPQGGSHGSGGTDDNTGNGQK